MFKERLKIVGNKICYGLLQLFVLILTVSIPIGLVILAIEFPVIDNIIRYIIYSFIGLIVLILVVSAFLSTYVFINWLFVEPYKEKRKMKS